MGSYVAPDSVRLPTNGVGAHLLVGIPLDRSWSVELNAFETSLLKANKTTNNATLSSTDGQIGFGADMRYAFLNHSAFTPYVLGGVGADWETYYYTKNEYHWGPYVDVGAGVLAKLTSHLSARLEARYYGIYNGESYTPHGLGDTRINLGLQYAFFRDPPPPAPPPAVCMCPNPPPPPPPPAPVAKLQPKCPPAPEGFKVDADGCIADQTIVLRGVNFQYNRHTLTPAAHETLRTIADALKAQPGLHAEVIGYTDSIGTDQYNLALSKNRAETVRGHLIEEGAKPSQLVAKGMGKANPVASNKTAAGRAANRRVEFKILNAPKEVKVIEKDPTESSKTEAEHGEPARLKPKQ
jgi:OOP family OmpA-OmpF porin